MSDNSTDSLLEELKNLNNDLKEEIKKEEITNSTITSSISSTSTPILSANPPFMLDNTNLNDFILQNAQKIVQEGVKTIKDLQSIVAATFDSKLLLGYAAIVTATTSSIDSLNKLNIEREKFKANKDLKILDIDSKKQLIDGKKQNNTINIIATREQILKMMNEVNEKPAIDVESTVVQSPELLK